MVSSKLKGLLKARINPPRKFSAISLKANPKIKAEIPAPASKPLATPLNPMVCMAKIIPMMIKTTLEVLLKKLTKRGS